MELNLLIIIIYLIKTLNISKLKKRIFMIISKLIFMKIPNLFLKLILIIRNVIV